MPVILSEAVEGFVTSFLAMTTIFSREDFFTSLLAMTN